MGRPTFATDIRRVALAMAAACSSKLVAEALIDALSEKEPTIRAAAFRALARRSATREVHDVEAVDDALSSPDAAIRHDAARILANTPADDVAARLSALLEDEDAMVRGIAIGQLGRHELAVALNALADTSSLVRQAALDGLIDAGDAAAMTDGVQVCLTKGYADTLADCLRRNPNLREPLLARLSEEKLSRLETLTALEALASA